MRRLPQPLMLLRRALLLTLIATLPCEGMFATISPFVVQAQISSPGAAVVVSEGGQPVNTPATGVSQDGSKVCTTWATFDQSPNNVYVRMYTPTTKAWNPALSSPAVVLSTGSSAVNPRCTVDSTGTTHVIWSEDGNLRHRTLLAGKTGATQADWSGADYATKGSNTVLADLAATNNGTVWVAYVDNHNCGCDDYKVYVKSWTVASGWSDGVKISNNGSGNAHFPRIDVDDAGYVHVIFFQSSELRYSFRNLAGAWSSDTVIAQGPLQQMGLAVNRQTGDSHVVFARGKEGSDRDEDRSVYYIKSTGGSTSTTFSQPVAITSQLGNYVAPRIAWSSSTLSVVTDERVAPGRTLSITSTDGGTSWAAPKVIDTETGISIPWIVMSRSGNSYVIWSKNPTAKFAINPDGSSASTNELYPPVDYQVPDCPGLTRSVIAFKTPPSIYGKPKTGVCGGTSTTGTSGATGTCPTGGATYGTGEGTPPAGTAFWTIFGGKTFSITQGFGLTDYAASADGRAAYDYSKSFNPDGSGTYFGHAGVDVGTPEGTPLFSPVAGTVGIVGGQFFYYGDGGSINQGELMIQLDNGDQLILGHMLRIDVKVGDKITAGQPVGQSGREGTGPHVHVEYRHGSIVQDPRDVFGCNGGTGTTTPVTTSTAPSTGDGAASGSYDYFMKKYGFDPVASGDASSYQSLISQNAANLGKEKALAYQYAKPLGVDPELVVWWTVIETLPPYNSVSYNNCNDQGHNLTPTCGSNSWQIGYGQQWADRFGDLSQAFEKIYGDPTSVDKTLSVAKAVNQAAGIGTDFTAKSVAQIQQEGAAPGTANRDLAFALMRDPAISVYLLSLSLVGINKDRIVGWGSYYSSHWADFSGAMQTVVNMWNGLAGAIPGTSSCVAQTPSTSTCSTMGDQLSMSPEAFVQKINENLADYKKIADCADVPWEMMAAINFRETGLRRSLDKAGTGGALGPWQIDPSGPAYGKVDPNNFYEAGCYVAKVELQAKAQSGPLARPLTKTMDPANKDDANSIKDAFFAYNGRGGYQVNIGKGCTPALEGHTDWNWDCSAYVMSRWDDSHMGMCINDSTYCPDYDGAWKVYFKLKYSTYGSDGKLLVYGGQCSQSLPNAQGLALPTNPNKQILTQFNQNGNVGINIGNAENDPVFALADGEILDSGWSDTGGYFILLHLPGTQTSPLQHFVYYGNLSPDNLTPKGSQVKAGQQIGKTGARNVKNPQGQVVPNGVATQVQLHFDIRGDVKEDLSASVGPCQILIFQQGYPSLDCTNFGGGRTWN